MRVAEWNMWLPRTEESRVLAPLKRCRILGLFHSFIISSYLYLCFLYFVEVQFSLFFFFSDIYAIDWQDVLNMSKESKMKLCIKIYERLHKTRVGKLLYSPEVAIYARGTTLQPVFFKDASSGHEFKKVRALGCTLRSGVFSNYREGPRDEFFVRPSVTPGKLSIFRRSKMNVYYLNGEMPGIDIAHYVHWYRLDELSLIILTINPKVRQSCTG